MVPVFLNFMIWGAAFPVWVRYQYDVRLLIIGVLPDPPKSLYKQRHSIILADSLELNARTFSLGNKTIVSWEPKLVDIVKVLI